MIATGWALALAPVVWLIHERAFPAVTGFVAGLGAEPPDDGLGTGMIMIFLLPILGVLEGLGLRRINSRLGGEYLVPRPAIISAFAIAGAISYVLAADSYAGASPEVASGAVSTVFFVVYFLPGVIATLLAQPRAQVLSPRDEESGES